MDSLTQIVLGAAVGEAVVVVAAKGLMSGAADGLGADEPDAMNGGISVGLSTVCF